ncbi:unnamed protein product [Dicrocoelium dendriticum]|nr:unnamed protein product [Dicrocoelium dendriticum]
MPCSLSGVKPLPRPLPTPSEFYLPETQPPELPRQPSSDSPTGSTQPWSDSPAVPKPLPHPRNRQSPSTADTHERIGPQTPPRHCRRGRRISSWDEDARISPWDEDAWISSWDEDRGLKCGGGSDTSQAHRRVCSKGKVLSAFFWTSQFFCSPTSPPRRPTDDALWSTRSS